MNVYNENIAILGKFDLDNCQRLLARHGNRFLIEDENYHFSYTYDLFADKQFFTYTLEKLFAWAKKKYKYEFIFMESVDSI